jgi:hypothetical protein
MSALTPAEKTQARSIQSGIARAVQFKRIDDERAARAKLADLMVAATKRDLARLEALAESYRV